MQQSLIPRVAVVAVVAIVAAGSVFTSTAGATLGRQARAAQARMAACAAGDTSGSCRLQSTTVTVDFNACPQTASCNATVIQLKKDANHPYGVNIVLPPISGVVPAKQRAPKADVFTILLPPATQTKSIQPGYGMGVAEDPSGVFSLQVTDRKGQRVTLWSPPIQMVPPFGYRSLQTLARAGWVRADYYRVQGPGLYRWAK
jgi:hypothetical protein